MGPRLRWACIQGWTSLGESGPAPINFVYMPEINRVPPNPPEFHNPEWYNRRGRVTDWNVTEQVIKGDFPGGLKDLDTTNPDVTDALIDVFTTWITALNIDGYRIDTVKHVEHAFSAAVLPSMRRHCQELGKDNFLMFGEIFDGNDALISPIRTGELDSTFYFSHKFQVFDDVFKRGSPRVGSRHSSMSVRSTTARLRRRRHRPCTPRVVGQFHRQPRHPTFHVGCGGRAKARGTWSTCFRWMASRASTTAPSRVLPVAMTLLTASPCGGRTMIVRGPSSSTRAALTRLRKTYAPLRRGDFQIRWATDRISGEEDANVIAFERSWEGQSALVVVHAADGTAHTSFEGNDMPVSFTPGTSYAPCFRWRTSARGPSVARARSG